MALKAKGARKAESEEFARSVLVQRAADLQTQPNGDVVDVHPRAVEDLFVRRLREQARNGVGTQEGMLPASLAKDLLDRAYGKPLERVKLTTPPRPFSELTDAELAAKLGEMTRNASALADETIH